MSIAASTTAMNPTPDPAAVPAVWTRLFSQRVARRPERRPMSPMTRKPRKALTTEMFGPYPIRSVTIGSAAPMSAATTQATSTARSVISRRASAFVTGRRSRSGSIGCRGRALETSCGSTARGVPPFTSRMEAQTNLLSCADEQERPARQAPLSGTPPRCAKAAGCKSFYSGAGWRGFGMAKGWQDECGISEEGVEILSWVEALPEEARKEIAATVALLCRGQGYASLRDDIVILDRERRARLPERDRRVVRRDELAQVIRHPRWSENDE